MMRVFVGILLSVFAANVGAQAVMELKGSNYACGNPSQMNLWDLSRDSALVRHEMLQKDYCWKAVQGLRVSVVDHVGRFSHVQHVSNGISFYVYRSELRMPSKHKEEKAAPEKMVERRSVRFVKVENTSAYGVTLIRNRPTVSVIVDAGGGLVVDFTIRKDKLELGFEATINDQRGDSVQVGGTCQGMILVLDSGDEFRVKVLTVDKVRKIAEFEVGGTWNKCDRANALSYRLMPSKFKIEGRSFDELVREHTAKELQKTIS